MSLVLALKSMKRIEEKLLKSQSKKLGQNASKNLENGEHCTSR
jgi:hypothetical protein